MLKKTFCILLCLALLSAAAYAEESPFPVAEKLEAREFSFDGGTLPYRIHIPEDYDAKKSYPVLLFLHGAGEVGNDNVQQIQVGVQNLFDTRPELLEQCIFLLPQCPEGEQWVGTQLEQLFNGNYSTESVPETHAMKAAIALLESTLKEYSCDENRVFIMGLSMGGFGTWDALVRHGEMFAAAVPICGGGDEAFAEQLAEMPIWAYHCTGDPLVKFEGTQRMYDLITAAGGVKIRFTPVESESHDAWSAATSDGELIDWLFAQSRAVEPMPTEAPAVPDVSPEADDAPAPVSDPASPLAFVIVLALMISVMVVLIKKR